MIRISLSALKCHHQWIDTERVGKGQCSVLTNPTDWDVCLPEESVNQPGLQAGAGDGGCVL